MVHKAALPLLTGKTRSLFSCRRLRTSFKADCCFVKLHGLYLYEFEQYHPWTQAISCPFFDNPCLQICPSDFLSRLVDVKRITYIYAGVQKRWLARLASSAIIKTDGWKKVVRCDFHARRCSIKIYVDHDFDALMMPRWFSIFIFRHKSGPLVDDNGGLAAGRRTK